MSLPQPAPATVAPGAGLRRTGILPSQEIERLIDEGFVTATSPITPRQVQPASLDLRLGAEAHRVRASFLPGIGARVRDKIQALGMHTMDLTAGAVLERGCVYIVRLQEEVRLAEGLGGAANPKSSTGRIDVFTRLITDEAAEFDRVGPGYAGPLYAEISPRTFSVLAREGDRLSQLRFRRGPPPGRPTARWPRQGEGGAGSEGGAETAMHQVPLSVDLRSGTGDGQGLVGYRAKHHADLIDLSKIGYYDPLSFWEPIHARESGSSIILNPDDFYVLSSIERVTIPPHQAAELVPYDALVGEFRVHYAGFFDPGFGHTGSGGGTRAVLEVRSRDVPFVLNHGQIIGHLAFEQMAEPPDRLYGAGIGSNYNVQTLSLSKHFRAAR